MMHLKQADVSVVIVSYNTRRLIEQCLNSLLQETSTLHLEVIVIDNASTDDSCELIKRQFPSVHLIENTDNQGFARGTNAGIRASTGRLIMLLNPDTVVLDGAIVRMVEFLENSASAGACCPKLLNPDGSYQRSVLPLPVVFSPFYEHSGLFERLPMVARILVPDWIDLEDVSHSVGYTSGACLLVKRACVDEIGLLDEGFFLYGEDVDWCRRMHDAGWQIVYLPHARVIHYEGSSQAPTLERRMREHKGELSYLRKWHGGAYTAAYQVLVWLCSLIRYLRFLWRRWHYPGDHERLSGYIDFYRWLLTGRHSTSLGGHREPGETALLRTDASEQKT